MIPISFDTQLGAPLWSTWWSTFLYAIEITQVFKYYEKYHTDSRWRKAMVGLIVFFETMSVFSSYVFIYQYVITHWGDVKYLRSEYWPQVVVQFFLIFKVYSILRKMWVVVLLSLGPLFVFSGALGVSIINILHPGQGERYRAKLPVMLWIVVMSAADIAIAGTLVWRLNQLRVEAAQFVQSRAVVMIKKLMLATLTTGTLTSMFAVVLMGFYIQNPENNIAIALSGPLSRVYALCLLANLNIRPVPEPIPNPSRVAPLHYHNNTLPKLDEALPVSHETHHSDLESQDDFFEMSQRRP
ncbi:hypothetical protein T439DRAFT_233490 [Meredithblackwellia eburnea MCA 4105]